jgi:tetratricopeptide (TPR) repeat protein
MMPARRVTRRQNKSGGIAMRHHDCIAAVTLLALTLAAPPTAAQIGHEHAAHAPATRILGNVNFPVQCSAAAQEAFNRGMLLQHSFWYEAASAAFREARQADPGCTMTHWGEALSLLTNPYSPPTPANLRQGRILLEEARHLPARNEREAAYIEALSLVFAGDDLAGHRARVGAYRDAMARFHQRFPDDTEGAIQYALVLGVAASPTDKTYADQLRGAEILEREWPRQPDHPGIVHYLIHLYDYPPLAERGIRAAERYADLAADAAHAQHMPSHIFTRVGRWESSIETNRRAADRAVAANDTEQEFHAHDYMVYAYLQTGQDQAARRAIDGVGGTNGDRRQAHAFASAAMPARYVLERGAWAEAALLMPRQTNFLFTDALIHFARAYGLARVGRPAEAVADIAALARITEALRTRDVYWSEQVDIQRQAAAGWAAFASGQREAGLVTLREAAEREGRTEKHVVTPGPLAPARELLAEALLEARQHAAAQREFETVQRTEPRRFRAVYGAARAAELAGDHEAARRTYTQLLEIAAKADTPRPELAMARAYLGQN